MNQVADDEERAPTRIASTPAPRGRIRRFINRWEVDQAVFFAICLRAWQFVSGPVSMLLISTFFTPDVQGFYYTFASLMAMQNFFELGLQHAVVNVCSHEWERMRLTKDGGIAGDPVALARLADLGRWLWRWYASAAFLFTFLVGVWGWWFLSRRDVVLVDWHAPWAVLVCLNGVLLSQIPFVTLLEGCGQVVVVNRFRVYQAVTGSLVVWACLGSQLGLWTAVAATAVQASWNSVLILGRFRRFFRSLRTTESRSAFDWRTELWPMQWRLAVSGIVNYFAGSLFVPVMFHYHGPAEAGKMGMTWQLLTVLQAVALAWIQPRIPLFGRLIARRDYRELDRVYLRLTTISFGVVVAGGLALVGVVAALNHWEWRLARSLLPPWPTCWFALAIVAYHVPNCQAYYIRAHRRDPVFPLSITASLVIGSLVWWFGSTAGATAAAAAYFVVVGGLVLPWQTAIWRATRADHEGLASTGQGR